MIVAATLTVGLDCPKCKNAIPVNGIATTTRCDDCGAQVPLDWEKLLDLSYINALERALDLKPGREEKGPYYGVHLVVARLDPTCAKCKAPQPLDELVALAERGQPGVCACGATFPLRAAPPELRAVYPAARALVHEGIVADEGNASAKREPIVFACMSCGGGLDVDGADRSVTCHFCKKVNYLPDGVWLRLHPPRQLDPFFVLSDIDDAGVFASEYRKGTSEKAERDAKRPDLEHARMMALARGAGDAELTLAKNPSCTPEVLLVLANHSDWRVRDAATKHPKATDAMVEALVATSDRRVVVALEKDDDDPWDDKEFVFIGADARTNEKTLETLAKRGDEVVRRAVVGNASTPLATALAFADDEDEDVRAALAKRPDLPAELVAKLALDEDATVRGAIAHRDDLSPETCAALAADADRDVLVALAKSHQTPPEILTKLAKSSEDRVSEAAKANSKYQRKWWDVF